MELLIKRYSDNGESTLGLFFIDGKFVCYTLEDEYRETKVKKETRIPEGTYKIGVRTVGGTHARYGKKYTFHEGMLQILDVPGFEYILIHTGNTDEHTEGCVLVGNTVNNNQIKDGFLGDSVSAYKRIYPLIINEAQKNNVIIHIQDERS